MTADSRGGGGDWQRVEELLAAALEREPPDRAAFLDEACAGDVALRREVESLLAAHDRSGALDRLGADIAPLTQRTFRPAALLEGRTIGRYRVLEQVGGGGMGIVHRARDTHLDRDVALKFLQAGLYTDDSAAERFRLEARAIAALEHQNICTVYEIGETADGQLFLAMPLYDGETLQRRIARGPLPVGDALRIAVQVARGLSKAHARGIVHRDIKPSNVLVTGDGVVKILDFGIAKLSDVTLTGAAGPLGTIAYMSPEQARGERVDHRTDVWSLGVMLYEMLAGRRPFSGTASEVWAAIQHAAPPSLLESRADIPPELERVVLHALAASPDARPASAAEFEHELLALGLISDPSGGIPTAGAAPRVAATVAAPVAASRARPWRRVAAVAALLLIVVAGWFGAKRMRGGGTGAPATTPPTIAVLPFADRSPKQDQEYFSDGITEELIATLARVDGLRVASRTSTFALRNRELDIREMGRQLRVATVLEGSVRRDGDRLRIIAQLVSVEDGYQLWSETFDRDARDAFAVQQEIALAIAQTLRVRLVGVALDTSARSAPDSAGYDLYLKGRHALYLRGRYAWYMRTEEGLRTAANYFEQAVTQSPGYARAHAGLADAYAVLGFYDYMAPTRAFPRAEAAALEAATLDSTFAGPRATLGYVALYHHWDLRRGEEEFRRAIALEPNYATAHQWYANLLVASGRFPEAEAEMRRATEIDPLSLIANAALGWVFYHAGDYAAAVQQCRQTLDLNRDYGLARLWMGWALQAMDSLPAAIAAHRAALAASDSGVLQVTSLARSLALAGERAEAEALLAKLESRRAAGGYVSAYEVARVLEALGRRDAAFAALERALEERSHSMVFLRVDPQLARLRDDPRFARLVARVFPR